MLNLLDPSQEIVLDSPIYYIACLTIRPAFSTGQQVLQACHFS